MKRLFLCLAALYITTTAFAEFREPRNLAHLAGHCDLDEAEVETLLDRGLLVLDDQPATNLYSVYYDLYLGGPPVYVTSDAMLYLWYEAHRKALIAAEEQILAPRLLEFVAGLFDATEALRAEGDSPHLRANAVLLATVRALLDPVWQAPAEISEDVAAEVARVREHTLVQHYPGDDYTQYEVRGHYTSSEALSRYFRGAKYLARRIFRVEDPNHRQDATRELQRAALLALAMREGDLRGLYADLHDLRAFLAGPADTIRLDQLADACAAAWGEGWSREEVGDVAALRAELADDRYPTTRINTRASWDFSEVMDGKKIVGVLGEHYIPDSDLFMHTCRPRIPGRNLPSGLDVATALGSEAAAEKLRRVASEFPDVVPAAREFAPQMTGGSIYGKWLGTLEMLFDEPEGLPEFAKTAAWDDKQINACLTSWAHLRHNYILYGAQAYVVAGAGSGSGIVEPLPRFFAEYAELCEALRNRLVAEGLEGRATEVIGQLQDKAEVFGRCAEDQLAGRDTSWAREHVHDFSSFIKRVYFDTPLVIADVASSTELESVLHAASGPFYPVVALVEDDEGWYGVVGYVGSYYELVEPRFGRISDEEWKSRVEAEYARPEPPEWLAGLYPEPAEQSAARERLGEIEALLRTDLDAGVAAAEAFMSEHRGDEWEPAAGLIAAQVLNDAEQYQRTVDLLAELRRMYGSDARDAAKRVRRRAQWQVDHADRRQTKEETLEEKLAPTAPRDGLSPEEEIARQNARAEVLLQSRGHPGIRGMGRTVWQRILDECPRSQYVPLAEMGMLYDVWDEDAAYGAGNAAELLKQWAEETRPQFEALGERYSDSVFGLYARTAAASTLIHAGEYRRAFERLKPLLEAQSPEPEPYLKAVEWPERLHWHYGSGAQPCVDAERAAQRLIEAGVPWALQHGEVGLIAEMMEAIPPSDIGGGPERLRATMAYYADEPEAFAAFGPILALEFSHGGGDITPQQIRELSQRALRVAEDHPGTKTARAALVVAYMFGDWMDGYPGVRELAERAQKRLAEEYPESLEGLLIRSNVLSEKRRFDEAQPLYERAMAMMEEQFEDGEHSVSLISPLEPLTRYRSPAKQKSGRDQALASRRERWGALVKDAGLSEDYLVDHYDRDEIMHDLLERMPDRWAEILSAAGDVSRVWEIAEPILEAHPDDSRTSEMRWEVGGRGNLLWIAAQGPKARRYEDAVSKFANSYPHMGHDRGLRTELTACRQEAAEYEGTPAEVLALECAGRTYLRQERPERAVEFLKEALERVEEGRPLRERLVDALTAARRQVEAKHVAAPRKLWEAEREVEPARSGQDSAPLLMHDGRVITEDRTDQQGPALVCRDADSGEEAWRAPVAPPSMLAVAGDGLIVGTQIGLVQCLDAATGEARWTHEMGIDQSGGVLCAVAGDVVVATWEHGLLKGLDLRTGEELWRQDLLPPSRAAVLPAIHADLAYVWDAEGRLHALGLADGAKAWTWDPREIIENEWEIEGPMVGAPALVDGRLIVLMAGRARLVVALDPVGGELLWHRPWKSSTVSPLLLVTQQVSGGRVLVRSGGSFVCMSVEDGRELWSASAKGLTGLSLVDTLCVGAGRGGSIVIIDTDLGEVVAGFEDIGARSGIIARERDGGLRVWALSGEAVTAWELSVPSVP